MHKEGADYIPNVLSSPDYTETFNLEFIHVEYL